MAKVALLIGVSDYAPGLNPLPGAAKDVEAMQRVLLLPESGGFAEAKTLPNPDPLVMQEAIETLFSGRTKDDLVLLFFSGHGVKDDSGKLYFATRITRKNAKGELVKATAVPASFVHDIMSNSRSKRQVVILDCCFSGAFAEGLSAKDDGSVDIKTQLGGEGRVVLTSSTSTQYSFAQEGSPLSIYTRYLIEGIETGAADRDNDGVVSVDELHEYAFLKVQETAPAMKPEIYAVKEGFKIRLAQAPINDPKLIYRKEVEHRAIRGEISIIGRRILDDLRYNLGLPAQETVAIEAEVLKPHQEYKQKLQQYEWELIDAIGREYPLSDYTRKELQRYQEILGLRDEDIAPIEDRIAPYTEAVQSSNRVAEVIEAGNISRSEDVTPVKLPNEAVAGEAETPVSTATGLPVIPSTQQNSNTGSLISAHTNSVPIHRNPRLLIGAGIATLLALTGAIYGLRQWQDSQLLMRIKTLAEKRNYEECITTGQTITKNSSRYTDAQILLKQCKAGVNWQNFQTVSGHSDSVWSVALNPDGQTFTSGSQDKTIKIWDLRTGELLRTLSGHSNSVYSVAISPSGQQIASGSGDKTIKIWDLRTGKLLRTLSGHSDSVWSVAISPDGQTLASGSGDKTIKIWDLRTGKLLHTFSGHSDWVYSIAISPDGQTLASGSGDKTIKIWDLGTGKLLHTLSGHSDSVRSVAISPSGQQIASGSGDKTIKIWDLGTGKLLRTLFGHKSRVVSIAFFPDGQTLASSSVDKTINLWRLDTGELSRTLSGHSDWVLSVALSPDGQTLASGSKDKTIKIWRLGTGELSRTFSGHAAWVLSVAISPDGQTLASGSKDKTIKLWRLGTGELLRTLSGHSNSVYSLAFFPKGQTLASGSIDKIIKLWSLGTSQLDGTLTGHSDTVWSIAISPSAQQIASGSGDKTIKIWDLRTDKLLRTLTEHSGPVYSVAISPSGQTLASGSWDKTIKIWDLRTGKLLRTLSGHSDWVKSIAFFPDGQTLASGSQDKTIKIWRLGTGELLRTLFGHSAPVRGIAISALGQTLASASEDKTIKIWDLRTGELSRTLSGHSDWVLSVALSPDGQTLASVSKDKTIKIWRL